jgi:hypothetical protein
LGKQLGAQYVVAGSIAALGSQKLLIIAIIKIDELRQVAGDVQTYSAISEIRGKLPAMAKNIVEASRKDASTLPRLAVPPVRLAGGADTRDADTLAQLLAAHLVRSGKYAVYPRTKSLEQVQTEYGNQFGGDVADEYLPSVGMGKNPRLVLSVTARKLDKDTMFNAAVINLESGVQEGGDTVDYKSLEDGVRAMEELALKLTGGGAGQQAAAAQNAFAAGTGAAFRQAIAAINNDKAGGAYTVTLNGNVVSDPVAFTGGAVKTITLKGDGTPRVIAQNADGALFTVPAGVTLVLDNGVTLYGNDKTGTLVEVRGGTLRMNAGATLRGAKGGTTFGDTYNAGGGVLVRSGAFTMAGGEISGNSASLGGGVFVNSGTFTMAGGEISGNTASNWGGGVWVSSGGTFTMTGGEIRGSSASGRGGGGVCVGGGTFTMQGGEISGNTVSDNGDGGGVLVNSGTFTMEGGTIRDNSDYDGDGGGVSVDRGTFTMAGGEIRGNSAYSGGGVYVDGVGAFTMPCGEISGNTADYGGGVCVFGTFTMQGGEIRENTADWGGGGVYVEGDGAFTMQSGEIRGNTASNVGGGVCVDDNSTFTMDGGAISGNSAYSGGGVYVKGGTFTMAGGEISGNSADYAGGGVCVDGTFTMAGGEISGNSASDWGGGVWVSRSGAFTKRGRSTIDASNSAKQGKAAYVSSSPAKQRNSAAGPNVYMDSRTSGSAGGWE